MRRGLEISARSDDDRTIEDENGKRDTMSANAERQRLVEARDRQVPWRKWGPYLSERQWGTVREDYSEDGNAWDYFSHDQHRREVSRGAWRPCRGRIVLLVVPGHHDIEVAPRACGDARIMCGRPYLPVLRSKRLECLRAHRRNDGSYVVFPEDDSKSKVLMYRLTP